jgi:hypothetical protein
MFQSTIAEWNQVSFAKHILEPMLDITAGEKTNWSIVQNAELT